MEDVRELAPRRLTGEEGQGLVEYSLGLLLVAVALVGSVSTFGTALIAQYGSIVETFARS